MSVFIICFCCSLLQKLKVQKNYKHKDEDVNWTLVGSA